MELFEKARQLANLILDSEQGKNYILAKDIFNSNLEAHQKLNEYNRLRDSFKQKMQNGYDNDEEFEKQRINLNELATDIKKDKIISNFFKAEQELNELVLNVMSVFNSTLNGEFDKEEKGGCSGCFGCH